jgi:F-type H+-transporting ATPase subunit a
MNTQEAAAGHQAPEPHSADHHGGKPESPLEHVVQHPLIEQPAHLGPLTPDGKITIFSDQIAMIALAGVLLVALVPMVARRRKAKAAGLEVLVPTGASNGLEAICQYIRDEVAAPALHEHTDRFIKYIWSVFFFVLTVNILGLLPIPVVSNLFGTHLGGTATGNIR